MGIEFNRSSKKILMNLRKYALGLLVENGVTTCKPAITFLECNIKLTTASSSFNDYSEEVLFHDPNHYQRVIGRLSYFDYNKA